MTAEITRFEQLDYAGSEAINTLCTNLSFTGKDKKIIMVTSCRAAEGKSFLALNIMRTMSQLGKRVVLVDADLRRSVINIQFGIRLPYVAFGLAHYLAGMCAQEDILYETDYPGAFFIPVGRTVTNSLALLNTPLLGRLLRQLAPNSDYVIVDSPPIGAIIDPAEIAKSCDGALIVVTYNQVSRRELAEARRQIEVSGCEVLGAVLNNVDPKALSGRKYYYYNKHYGAYGEDSSRKSKLNRNINLDAI
jgi:capsular exopolysaccharide synthesis family protein